MKKINTMHYIKRKKILRIPVISISTPEEWENNQSNDQYDPDNVIILKIQDREIVSDKYLPTTALVDEETNPIVFNLILEATEINQKIEQKITLENKGVFAITYEWCNDSSIKSNIEFQYERDKIEKFMFNKNLDIILPGQIKIISVWYNPTSDDVENKSIEVWKFNTEPKISSTPIIFYFHGYYSTQTILKYNHDWNTSDNESLDDISDINIYEFIRRIITDLLNKVECVEFLLSPYQTNFHESNIFSRKNPRYIYNSHTVGEFKRMYNEATENTLSWQLSLNELCDRILHMNNNDANKKLLILNKFFILCHNSLKPSCYAPMTDTKYMVTYNILCSFVNKFENESKIVKRQCAVKSLISILELEYMYTNTTRLSSVSQYLEEEYEVESKHGSQISIHTHSSDINWPLYYDILLARIYILLCDSITKIGIALDSIENIIEDDQKKKIE